MSRRPFVIGATNLDLKGLPQHRLHLGVSNIGRLLRRPGGVAFNVAANLARLGCHPRFATVVGDDREGDYLRAEIELAGLDLHGVHVVRGGSTATYLAVLDERGDLAVGIADMDLYEQWQMLDEKAIREAPLVIADCNLSPQLLGGVADLCALHQVPLWVDPTAPDKCQRMRGLRGITYLSPNRQELEALTGSPLSDAAALEVAGQALRDGGIDNVLVKLGTSGVLSVTSSGALLHPSRTVPVCDVIGAGDAFTAGTVWGLLQGMALENAVECGIAAALVTIQEAGSNCPTLRPAQLVGERACG